MAIPDAIAGAPQLGPGLDVYWEAFQSLTTERMPGGMGLPGRIPWRAIHKYGEVYSFVGDSFEDLRDIIFAMDECFLTFLEKKFKKDNPTPPGD